MGHGQEAILALDGAVPGFERWGGGTEDQWNAFGHSAVDGDIASVVARESILFEGRFVFFVEDDQTRGGERGEDSAAGTDDDGDFS